MAGAKLLLLGLIVAACAACGSAGDGAEQSMPGLASLFAKTSNNVGFFAPTGFSAQLVSKTQFGMINAASPEQVNSILSLARGTGFKVNIDLGPVLAHPALRSSLKMTYRVPLGAESIKVFPPLETPKVGAFPDDDRLRVLLSPYVEVMKRHKANVGTVFLADEPYLNGISKAEMERAGRVARSQLEAAGLTGVKLGVIFASGMFNRDFAQLMAGEAARFADGIDTYYRRNRTLLDGPKTQAAIDFEKWVETIKTVRLSTYDTAGNMYTDGGIPKGFDVAGFDFYLSTVLLDALHEHTLSWFSSKFRDPGCAQFTGKGMSSIRKELSFFRDGPVLQGERYRANDRALLDAIFQCRMRSTLNMLKAETAGTAVQLLMISESSSNGVLEFDSSGNVEQRQPALLVEARALDEVRRAARFYSAHRTDFRAGLMFFTYQDEHDNSIGLNIGGASAMPSVLAHIFRLAGTAP